MNNGYQKSNGCGADKEGGKIFNTFFYPELQSKHVRPLATNVSGLCVVALSINLKLTTTLDRAITQSPCYVPLNFKNDDSIRTKNN